MKNKLIRLSSYLAKLGHIKESSFINKFAAYSEEDIKQNFENIYNKLFPQGMSALNEQDVNKVGMIIAQALKSMTEDEVLIFDSIEEISHALKTRKKEKKKEKRKDILNEYKELDKEMKNFIIENNLSNEEVNFAYHKRSGHELFDCLRDILRLKNDYFYLKNKMKDLPIIDKVNFKFGDQIIKFQRPELYEDIDKANDAYGRIEHRVTTMESGEAVSEQKSELLNYYNYIYNGVNKMNIKYDASAAGKAKSDSKILYNDGEWAIVHSWSEQACQYWERGAVFVHDDGTISFKTCTSRIHNNFYLSYKNYMMFQIIKLKNGNLSFFQSKDDMFTVCYGPKKDMISGSASVNAEDEMIIEEDLKNSLPDNIYKKFKDILSSKYFEEEVSIRKDKFVKELESFPTFYGFEEGYEAGYFSDDEASVYLADQIDMVPSYKIFKYMEKGIISKDIMDQNNKDYELYKTALNELASMDIFYFYEIGLVPKSYFSEYIDVITMDIPTEMFFTYSKKGLIPDDVFNDFVEYHANRLYSVTFFDNYQKNLIPEETFLKLRSAKCSELVDFSLLQFYQDGLITKDMFLENIVRASSRANDFFIQKIDKLGIVPEEYMIEIINNRAEHIGPYSLFTYALAGRLTEETLRSYAVKKFKDLHAGSIVELLEKGVLSDDLFLEILKNKDGVSYQEISSFIDGANLNHDLAKKLFISNSNKVRPNNFYYMLNKFKEIIKPDDFSEDVLKDKAKGLEKFELDVYYEAGVIPEKIYNSVLIHFIKSIQYYEMLNFVEKGVVHKDFLIYMPYEKLEYAVNLHGCYIIIDKLNYIKSLNNQVLPENYEKVLEKYCKDRL